MRIAISGTHCVGKSTLIDEFLRAHTDKPIKITIPGAFTMAKMALDQHYGDLEALIMAYAAALNEEVRELKTAGADVITTNTYSTSQPALEQSGVADKFASLNEAAGRLAVEARDLPRQTLRYDPRRTAVFDLAVDSSSAR